MISFEKVFVLKLVFCFFTSVFLLFITSTKIEFKSFFHNRKNLIFSFFLFRLLPFIVVYIYLNQTPRGDIPFFFPKAEMAIAGKMVYKDFLMYHAPIFPYIISLSLVFWKSSKSLVLLFLVGEFTVLLLTINYLKPTINKKKLLYLSHLYFILPAPLIIVLLGGQEDIWLWGIFVLGLWLYNDKKNIFVLGLVLSFLITTLKFTAIIVFIPIFFMIGLKDKLKLFLSVAIPTLLILGYFYLEVGNNLFMFIKHTVDPYSPNLYSISNPIFASFHNNFNLTQLNWIYLSILSGILMFLGISFYKLPLEKALPHVWIISFGLFNILLPASMLYYTFIYLIAIWFFLIKHENRTSLLIFLIFNTLIISQPYLFVNQGSLIHSDFSFIGKPIQTIEYVTELLSVTLIVYYCLQSWKQLMLQKREVFNSRTLKTDDSF